jgi:uncharacterized protein YjbJ (UPF0337 family)
MAGLLRSATSAGAHLPGIARRGGLKRPGPNCGRHRFTFAPAGEASSLEQVRTDANVVFWRGTITGRRSHLAQRDGIEEAVKGAVEGVKGKAKEVAGKVTGRDDLRSEGEAQQDKADAQRDAAKREAESGSARGSAKANEKREAAEQ